MQFINYLRLSSASFNLRSRKHGGATPVFRSNPIERKRRETTVASVVVRPLHSTMSGMTNTSFELVLSSWAKGGVCKGGVCQIIL